MRVCVGADGLYNSTQQRERQREVKGKERAEIKRKADRHTQREREARYLKVFSFFPLFPTIH